MCLLGLLVSVPSARRRFGGMRSKTQPLLPSCFTVNPDARENPLNASFSSNLHGISISQVVCELLACLTTKENI